MTDVQEIKLIAKGYYLAKGVEHQGEGTWRVEFIIHRGEAGFEWQSIFMPIYGPGTLDTIRSKMVNNGWCIIKVLHKREDVGHNQTAIIAYVNEVRPLEK